MFKIYKSYGHNNTTFVELEMLPNDTGRIQRIEEWVEFLNLTIHSIRNGGHYILYIIVNTEK
jgi:hypothetical protein